MYLLNKYVLFYHKYVKVHFVPIISNFLFSVFSSRTYELYISGNSSLSVHVQRSYFAEQKPWMKSIIKVQIPKLASGRGDVG